jgi:hypothetical protein
MTGKKNHGLIQGYLISIQESHNKSNELIFILFSSFKEKKRLK